MRQGIPSVGYQVVLRLEDDRVIARDAGARRALARTLARIGRERGLLAFGAADTHVHVLSLADRAAAGVLARSLERALPGELGLPVRFAPARITPVNDQHHLGAVFGYVQTNARRHGIADPEAAEASSLHDLLRLRTGALWLADRVRQALPIVGRADLLKLLGAPGLGVTGDVGPDLPDACAAAFGIGQCVGISPVAIRARAAGISEVAGIWTNSTIASAFGVSVRTVERVRLQGVDPLDRQVLQRQLAWRAALRRGMFAGGG